MTWRSGYSAPPARSANDLRLKVDFYRREDPLTDDDWLASILADVEHMLLTGVPA